jgi:Tfp pilus assembly protein PilF
MRRLVSSVLLLLALASCAKPLPIPPEARRDSDMCAQRLGQDDPAGAKVLCQDATARAPQFAEPWILLGVAHIQLREWSAAETAIAAGLKLDDRSALGHTAAGVVEYAKARYSDAESRFRRALRLRDTYGAARYNLALTLVRLRQNAAAKTELQTLQKQGKELGDAYHLLGVVLLSEGKLVAGTDTLIEALKVDPNRCDYWHALATAHTRERRWEDAETVLKNCGELCPGHPPCAQASAAVRHRDSVPLPDLLPPRT